MCQEETGTFIQHTSLQEKTLMKNVGFIGWRGMVGSVLMQRMVEERDFDAIRPVFFLYSAWSGCAVFWRNY
ncbi:hypothetical protein ECZU24_53690 [Escherichia coli]|nr:hypothetical protein ECZU24_53690 [Escherichia coli]